MEKGTGVMQLSVPLLFDIVGQVLEGILSFVYTIYYQPNTTMNVKITIAFYVRGTYGNPVYVRAYWRRRNGHKEFVHSHWRVR